MQQTGGSAQFQRVPEIDTAAAIPDRLEETCAALCSGAFCTQPLQRAGRICYQVAAAEFILIDQLYIVRQAGQRVLPLQILKDFLQCAVHLFNQPRFSETEQNGGNQDQLQNDAGDGAGKAACKKQGDAELRAEGHHDPTGDAPDDTAQQHGGNQ